MVEKSTTMEVFSWLSTKAECLESISVILKMKKLQNLLKIYFPNTLKPVPIGNSWAALGTQIGEPAMPQGPPL